MYIRRKFVPSSVKKGTLWITLLTLVALPFLNLHANATAYIIFPVLGGGNFTNDYDSARADGPHHATDIFAPKMRPLVAATDGVISYVAYPQPSWGFAVFIRGDDGYTYKYLHINNDTPGTDDGVGDPMHAYAADIERGNRVKHGQLIGWLGDSGNAENTAPHLHFEIEDSNGNKINPYPFLVYHAPRISEPNPYPQLAGEILPFGPNVWYRANVAVGNLDADSADEIVFGAGPGPINPQVKMYEQNGTLIKEFDAHPGPGYGSGVDVAIGDLNGDGVNELITGAGPESYPIVKVFKVDGTQISSVMAYEDSARPGLVVSAGDVDGDGKDEVVTGLRTGGLAIIKIFDLDANGVLTMANSFYAYQPVSFAGGVDVAVGDVRGDIKDEIAVIPIAKSWPDVKIFDNTGTQLTRFFAYFSTYEGGSRITIGEARGGNDKREILTVPVNATSNVKMFNGNGNELSEGWVFEPWWKSNFDIAAGNNSIYGSTGTNRRMSIRKF
jgi:murein DD-endopeptidase MepM/ murein hydrolase activator NlpD